MWLKMYHLSVCSHTVLVLARGKYQSEFQIVSVSNMKQSQYEFRQL